jgi:hypothetical protein
VGLAIDVLLIGIEVRPRLLEGDATHVHGIHLGRNRRLGRDSFAAVTAAPRDQQRNDTKRASDRHAAPLVALR